ncbi:hypothetical protein BD311DRAFT_654539 [Dichomitus squalens]|uniref:Uncharacterized protein n=1 Tax=Dichomitus squalens TaxID=114155 RepID=A0A4Q9MXF7_9APHY|nr:hypothetical protein BD311DRAFT_654539 [Dichomitus squalens]
MQSRQRRKAAAAQNAPGRHADHSQVGSAAKVKTLNINTIKYHRLGDYVRMVCRTGTSDNANTQTVSGVAIFRSAHMCSRSKRRSTHISHHLHTLNA